MYVPTPGRVQYYRAETLPFVPVEIKTQLRFPKAYANSEPNLRYTDTVKDLTQKFMDKKIHQNFFTGEKAVPMDATLGEVETLYSASSDVQALAASGSLNGLHERCAVLSEASESQYISLRDKVENIIKAIETKEDEIYTELEEDYSVKGISTNENAGFFATSGLTIIENLKFLKVGIESAAEDDVKSLTDLKSQLVALLGAKTQAYETLAALQQGYSDHVEPGDAANLKDLADFESKQEQCGGVWNNAGNGTDGVSDALSSQLTEIMTSVSESKQTFLDYATACEERTQIFSNFSGVQQDSADAFKNELLQHLSMNIVVKENRQRYQQEQFSRLINSAQVYQLKNKNQSMDQFCTEYCKVIEQMIEQSHNYKCSKIHANYDDMGDQTIRPLNSTIFYYFFSADRTRRNIAQWMLSTVRYPNEKVRRAYMRFFA